jgi:hypothetical protein
MQAPVGGSAAVPTPVPEPEKTYLSPTDSEIVAQVAHIRSKDRTLGISKVFAAVKIVHPGWSLSEKRLKKVLASAVCCIDKKKPGYRNGLITVAPRCYSLARRNRREGLGLD